MRFAILYLKTIFARYVSQVPVLLVSRLLSTGRHFENGSTKLSTLFEAVECAKRTVRLRACEQFLFPSLVRRANEKKNRREK